MLWAHRAGHLVSVSLDDAHCADLPRTEALDLRAPVEGERRVEDLVHGEGGHEVAELGDFLFGEEVGEGVGGGGWGGDGA